MVLGADDHEVQGEVALDDGREHGDTVFVAFAASHSDLISREVEILNSEAAALQHAQASAVEQVRHEVRHARESLKHRANLLACQDDG
jgi:hypothetical protein